MNSEKIIESLREALRLSPDNLPLRIHLASVLLEAGKHREALEEYERVGAHDALASLVGSAKALFGLERHEEAAVRLQDALRKNESSAEAHLEMARVLLALAQREAAGEHYRRAIALDPSLFDPEMERSLAPPPPAAEEKRVPVHLSGGADLPPDPASLAADAALEIEQPALKFADVGGMEDLKEQIRMNIIYPFLHPEMYLAYGKKTGGGILLYGPPGCGKTYIAKATAGECNARFVSVGIEDVIDMWMGQSEKKLHALFEAARAYPAAILFFDEVEAFAGSRMDMKNSPHYRVLVNQFLAEMDGAKGENRNILIIGATNSPWHVDSAFRRPGRFDKVIFVPPPDLKARVEILKIHCRNKPVENLDYEKLAAQMKRFSGADIQAVCDGAAEIGLRETMKTGKIRKLRADDFQKVLKTIRPTTDEWLATAQNYATYSNQTGLYNPLVEYFQHSKE